MQILTLNIATAVDNAKQKAAKDNDDVEERGAAGSSKKKANTVETINVGTTTMQYTVVRPDQIAAA